MKLLQIVPSRSYKVFDLRRVLEYDWRIKLFNLKLRRRLKLEWNLIHLYTWTDELRITFQSWVISKCACNPRQEVLVFWNLLTTQSPETFLGSIELNWIELNWSKKFPYTLSHQYTVQKHPGLFIVSRRKPLGGPYPVSLKFGLYPWPSWSSYITK